MFSPSNEKKKSKGSISSGRYLSQISPGRIAVKETQSISHSEILCVTHSFSNNFNETISESCSNYESHKSVEALPDLLDAPGKFGRLNRLWPISVLTEILKLTKNKSSCRFITQADLNEVIDYCNYNGSLLYVSGKEAAQLCFKILANLAEKGWRLPHNAIIIIIDEVIKCRKITLNYAVLALAYAIHNGQCTADILETLDEGIETLRKLKPQKYFETIVIALAAKAKLNSLLTEEELNLLELSLMDISDKSIMQNFYIVSRARKSPLIDSISSLSWRSTITEIAALKLIYSVAKKKKDISIEKLKYVISRWETASTDSVKILIMEIIHNLILNGQRQFLIQNKAMSILTMALDDNDIDIRQLATSSANCLHINGELDSCKTVHNSRIVALNRQRKFALEGLCDLLNCKGNEAFYDVKKWMGIFKKIQSNTFLSSRLRNTASYISSRLEGTIKILEDLILDSKHCINVTKTFLIAAQNKQDLSDDILEKLFQVFQGNLSIEAKKNAFLVFFHLAKSKKIVSELYLKFFIGRYLKSKDEFFFQNTLLAMLGHCVGQHEFLKKNIIKEVYFLIKYKHLHENIIFLIAAIIDASPQLENPDGLTPILDSFSNFLASEDSSEKIRGMIVILFGKLIEKNYPNELILINSLGNSLIFFKEIDVRIKILNIIGFCLQKSTNQHITPSNRFYENILASCSSDNEKEENDAFYVLEYYFQRVKILPDQEIIDKIAWLCIKKPSFLTSYSFFKKLVEVKCFISDEMLQVLLFEIDYYPLEEAIKILDIINRISQYQFLPRDLLEDIILLLNSADEEKIKYCILILENILDKSPEYFDTLVKSNNWTIKFLDVFKCYAFSFDLKIKAINILEKASKMEDVCFPIEFFSELIPLLLQKDTAVKGIILQIINNQIPRMELYIYNENVIFHKLMESVINLLYDEDQQCLVLKILRNAANLSYVIPKNVLSSMAQLLYSQNDTVSRVYIFKILTLNENLLSKKSSNILTIEKLARKISKVKSQILDSRAVLVSLISKSSTFQMTLEVFVGLKNIIKYKKEELFQELIELCISIQSQSYSIPAYVIYELSQFMKENEKHILFENFANIISTAIIQNQSADYDTYRNIEHLIKNANIQSHSIMQGIEALHIAIKRGFIVNFRTLQCLFEFALGENKDLALSSYKILLDIFKLKKIEGQCDYYPVKELLIILDSTQDETLKKIIHKLIFYISDMIKLDQEVLESVCIKLLDSNHFEEQSILLDTLLAQSTRQGLPVKCSFAIEFKQSELKFLSESTTSFEKFELISKLVQNIDLLTAPSFEILSQLLYLIPNYAKLQILNNLQNAIFSISFPSDQLILTLTRLLVEENFLVAGEILKKLARNKQFFKEDSLKILNSALIFSEIESVRDGVYRLLNLIEKYLSLPVKILLQVRAEKATSFNTDLDSTFLIENIKKYIILDCALSSKNIQTIIQLMHREPRTIFPFLDILNKANKELISEISWGRIEGAIEAYLLNDMPSFYYADTVELSIAILSTIRVSVSINKIIFQKLVSHINNCKGHESIITLAHLRVFQLLNNTMSAKEKEIVFCKLSEIFFKTNIKSVQLAIVSMHSQYIYSNPNINNRLLNAVKKFNQVFLQEEQKTLLAKKFIFSKWFDEKPIIKFKKEVTLEVANFFNHLLSNSTIQKKIFGHDFIEMLSVRIRLKKYGDKFLSLIKDISSRHVKVQLMLVFFSLKHELDMKTLKKLPSENYLIYLLCASLVLSCGKVTGNYSQDIDFIYWYIIKNNYSKYLQDMIRLLIIKQKNENLDLDDVCELISTCGSFQNSPVILTENNNNTDMKLLWLRNLFFNFSVCRGLSDNEICIIDNYFKNIGWDVKFVEKFFSKLKIDTTYENIIYFCDYCCQSNLLPIDLDNYFDEIEECSCDLKKLEQKILNDQLSSCIKFIIEKFPNNGNLNNSAIHILIFERVTKLCEYGWDQKKLIFFFQNLSSLELISYNSNNIYTFMEVIYRYREHIKEQEFYSLYEEYGILGFDRILHNHAMQNCFKKEKSERDLSELLHLLNEENFKSSSSEVTMLTKNLNVDKFFNLITETYITKNGFFNLSHANYGPINQWIEIYFGEWVAFFKERINKHNIQLNLDSIVKFPRFFADLFAVLKRACVIQFAFEPRIVQMLSLLILIGCKKIERGLFAEIATGEGKSLIIAMLAVIQALFGNNVDIVTSSPILATRDVEFFKSFYKLFFLNAASNIDADYKQGLKPCYQKENNIIYGDINNFQFDILREEYSRLHTRDNRTCDFVIVDEVDNLLIDEGSKIAMLSSSMPGMDELTPIFTLIWLQLNTLYLLSMKPDESLKGFEDEELENPFKECFYSDLPPNEKNKKFTEIMIKLLESYVDTVILPQTIIKYPQHLEQFIRNQKMKWINNAILAFYEYKVDKHYAIKVNQQGIESINPIDFSNTGVIQQGTMWTDGLSQFLQIKHGLKVTPENITTNYLSNVAFINKYKGNIVGITGTIGSIESQKLLDDVYNGIDFFKIPTFLPSQLCELPTHMVLEKDEWIVLVTDRAILEASFGRVCLVICETIDDAKEIKAALQDKFEGKCYVYADDLQDNGFFFNKELDSNSIIIATNLAGRGTDIKVTKNVIKKGGLHVCMTFIPANFRVERQAFGRAGRRGEQGSAELIFYKSTLDEKLPSATIDELKILDSNYSFIKTLRNKEERYRIDNFRAEEWPHNKIKEELFNNYLILLNELDKIDKDNSNSNELFNFFNFKPSAVVQNYYRNEMKRFNRNALEEQWGLWLKAQDFSKDSMEIRLSFEKFKKKSIKKYKNDTIIKNPIYYINLGNTLLSYANSLAYKIYHNEFCRVAISSYKRAIKLDPLLSFNAKYHKAYALTRLAKPGYKHKVKKLLEKLLKQLYDGPICQEQTVLYLLSQRIEHESEYKSQAYYSQVRDKLQVLHLFANAIFQSIQHVETSLKLIDIEIRDDESKKNFIFSKLLQEHAIDIISNRQGMFSVSFNNLKTHSDIWENSQLRDTVSQIPESALISITFDSKKLHINSNIKLAVMKLLPINRYKDETIDQEKETEESTKSDEKELFGALDYMSHAKDKVFRVGTKAITKISKGLKVASKPVTTISQYTQDFIYNNKEAEIIPVCLELKISDLKRLIKLLDDSKHDLFTLKITEPTLKLIKFIKAQGYPVKVKLRQCIVEENNSFCYEDISVNDFDKITKEMHFLHLEISNCSYIMMKKIINDFEGTKAQSYFKTLPLNSEISLKLINLSQEQAQEIIENFEGNIILSYERIGKEQAEGVLLYTGNQHDQAVMRISGLTSEEAIDLISNAERREQDLKPKHRSIKDELLEINQNHDFPNDFARNGYFYLYELNENNPMPWKSLILLVATSSVQIGGGIALATMTSGFGACMGFSLISDGINDLIRIATTASMREFSLNNYLIQKSISLSLSASLAGIMSAFTAIRAASMTASTVKKAISYADKATTSAILISNSSQTAGKHAFKQVMVKSAFSLAEKVTVEATTQGISKTSNFLLETAKPKMSNEINKEIDIIFSNKGLRQILMKAFATEKFIDSSGKYKFFTFRAQEKAMEIVRTLDFSLPSLKLTDDIGFAVFFSKFHCYLRDNENVLQNFEEVFSLKFNHIHLENIKCIVQLLRDAYILDDQGINLSHMISHYSTMKISPKNKFKFDREHYEVKNYDLNKIAWDESLLEYRQLIIKACLSYHVCLQDDYSYEYNKFSKEVANLFVTHVMTELESLAEVGEFTTSRLVSLGISQVMGSVANRFSDQSSHLHNHNTSDTTENLLLTSETSNDVRLESKQPSPQAISESHHKHLGIRIDIGKINLPIDPLVPSDLKKINIREILGARELTSIDMKNFRKYLNDKPLGLVEAKFKYLVNSNSQLSYSKPTFSNIVSLKYHSLFNNNTQLMRSPLLSNRPNLAGVNRIFAKGNSSLHRLLSFKKHFQLIQAPIEIGSKGILVGYKNELNKQIASIEVLLRQKACAAIVNSADFYKKILHEKAKIIHALIKIILAKSKNYGENKEPFNKEQIKYLANEILSESLEKEELGYNRAIILLNKAGYEIEISIDALLKEAFVDYFKTRNTRNAMLERFNYRNMANQLISYGKKMKFLQIGNFLKERSLSERGYLMGTTICKIGGIFNDLIEAKKISILGRVKIQTITVLLAEQCITEQMRIQKMCLNVEQVHQQIAIELAKIVEIDSSYINEHHTKMVEMLAKAFDAPDQETLKFEVKIINELNDKFLRDMNEHSEIIKDISRAHAIDSKFLAECSIHTADIISQCLKLVDKFAEIDSIELEKIKSKAFSSLKKISTEKQQLPITTEPQLPHKESEEKNQHQLLVNEEPFLSEKQKVAL